MDNSEVQEPSLFIQFDEVESPVENKIPMFKSERGFNINIAEIAKTIYEQGIDAVRLIAIPSVVREQHRGDDRCDTPTLSEVGVATVSYGTGFEFCQVIAGTDARPVNIDNVLFVNNDPANTGINHGTIGVGIGTYFAIGWKRRADSLTLIYRVIECEEYLSSENQPLDRNKRAARPIAKLTCSLAGHSTRTWRGESGDVPAALAALHGATEERMTSDYSVPVYMDMIRMISSTDASRAIASNMKQGAYGPIESCTPETFRRKIYAEIVSVRNSQYADLPTSGDTKRKVGPLHAVETIELDRELNLIRIEMVIPRTDGLSPVHYRTEVTADNFFDLDSRIALERGLVLKCSSFERFRTELESRRDPIISVHLTSIR